MDLRPRFLAGDIASNVVVAFCAALAVPGALLSAWPMPLAMLAAMVIGMVVGELLAAFVLCRWFGDAEIMLPGMVVGMAGGMAPVMAGPTLGGYAEYAIVALVVGGAGTALFRLLDWSLRGPRPLQIDDAAHSEDRAKWDRLAPVFDAAVGPGPRARRMPLRKAFFARMASGRILVVGIGTGTDIAGFPSGRSIVAIDVSPRMLDHAVLRARAYDGDLTLQVMDVHCMTFAENSFDQVFVPFALAAMTEPVAGLRAIRRVLKPGGTLHLLEQARSRIFPINVMQRVMTILWGRFGAALDRDPVSQVRTAGYHLEGVRTVYLDVIKIIDARVNHIPSVTPPCAEVT